MAKLEEAFTVARNYLVTDPIHADWSSVQPVAVVPTPHGMWIVACDFSRKGQQEERAIVFVNAKGEVTGFVRP